MLRDVDGVSGHKFEGSLKKVSPDHHNSLSTRSFPEQPLEGMSAGSCSQDKISTSLCLSVYGSRPPYAGLSFLIQQSVVNESTQ